MEYRPGIDPQAGRGLVIEQTGDCCSNIIFELEDHRIGCVLNTSILCDLPGETFPRGWRIADAYLGLGTANYFIGSQPPLKKFFLGIVGIHGDKEAGIQQIQITADHGHYLRPFAKIMLALAALREGKTEVARTQLRELVVEFPENPLFADELAKLKISPGTASPPQ
jgi:hypothetical protein